MENAGMTDGVAGAKIHKGRCCRVNGCFVNLRSIGKTYCLKKGLCPEHIKSDAVRLKGGGDQLWRFCQQCGRLEALSCFKHGARRCVTALAKRRLNHASKQEPPPQHQQQDDDTYNRQLPGDWPTPAVPDHTSISSSSSSRPAVCQAGCRGHMYPAGAAAFAASMGSSADASCSSTCLTHGACMSDGVDSSGVAAAGWAGLRGCAAAGVAALNAGIEGGLQAGGLQLDGRMTTAAAAAAAPEAMTAPFWLTNSMIGSTSGCFFSGAGATAMAAAAARPAAAASLTEAELEALIEAELTAAGLVQAMAGQGGHMYRATLPVAAGMAHLPGAAAALLPFPAAAGGAGVAVAYSAAAPTQHAALSAAAPTQHAALSAAAPTQHAALSARLAALVDEMAQVAAALQPLQALQEQQQQWQVQAAQQQSELLSHSSVTAAWPYSST